MSRIEFDFFMKSTFFNEIKYRYLKSGQEGIQSKVLLISDKLGHQGVGTKTGSEQWSWDVL